MLPWHTRQGQERSRVTATRVHAPPSPTHLGLCVASVVGCGAGVGAFGCMMTLLMRGHRDLEGDGTTAEGGARCDSARVDGV